MCVAVKAKGSGVTYYGVPRGPEEIRESESMRYKEWRESVFINALSVR